MNRYTMNRYTMNKLISLYALGNTAGCIALLPRRTHKKNGISAVFHSFKPRISRFKGHYLLFRKIKTILSQAVSIHPPDYTAPANTEFAAPATDRAADEAAASPRYMHSPDLEADPG